MRSLLPIPTMKYIPDKIKSGAEAFTDALDKEFLLWLEETIGIENLRDPARIPNQFLDVAGNMFAADINETDNENIKRVKIATATARNKRRGLWIDSVKPIIDAYSGGDSKIYDSYGTDDFIFIGTTGFEDTVWTVFGGDDPNSNFGIRFSSGTSIDGSMYSSGKGVILIDVGSSTMTYDEIENLKADLIQLVPAYYKIYLGYMVGDQFHGYENGEIN